jgi:hypothetical protein
MLSTKIKAGNAEPQKNTNSKFTRGLFGSLGLLFLVLVFGASSETHAQAGKSGGNPGKQNDPPPKEQPAPPREAPAPSGRGLILDCKPIVIQDDNGNITGGGISCTPKWDGDN